MRVLISADAEGVTGITNTNELMFGRPHYEFMRTMMTDDVNAAVEGAFAGGATQVVVNDGHWTMTNVQIERLDPRAELIKGFHKHLCMVEGVQDADVVFFLGYHARTGDSDGVGNETILGREIVEIRMRTARPVGESKSTPPCAASSACRSSSPPATTSTSASYGERCRTWSFGLTKYASTAGPLAASPPNAATPTSGRRRSAPSQRAISAARPQPYRLDGPISLSVTFSSTAEALMASLVPGSVRETPRIVTYTADSAVDAWKGFFAVLRCSVGAPPTRSMARLAVMWNRFPDAARRRRRIELRNAS